MEKATWGMIKGTNIRTGFFRASGNYRIAELVSAFQAWILKELPGAEHGTAGHKSVRDRLNSLGAMRLRFCYRIFKQAQKRMEHETHHLKGPSLSYCLVPVLASSTAVQSPAAHTLGNSGTAWNSFTARRPRSLRRRKAAIAGLGFTPAVK